MFTSGKTTQSNTYTPGQTGLQNQTLSTIGSDLSNPNAMFAPVEASGLSSIDESYKGVLDQMNRELASRGFTSSGTTGADTENILSQEAGAKGNFEGALAGQKIGETNTLLTDAMNAAFNPTGSTSTSQSSLLPSLLSGGLGLLTGGLTGGLGFLGGGLQPTGGTLAPYGNLMPVPGGPGM